MTGKGWRSRPGQPVTATNFPTLITRPTGLADGQAPAASPDFRNRPAIALVAAASVVMVPAASASGPPSDSEAYSRSSAASEIIWTGGRASQPVASNPVITVACDDVRNVDRALFKGFRGPHESTTVRLSRSHDQSGHLGVRSRPCVSTVVVSTALAVGLSAPKSGSGAAHRR